MFLDICKLYLYNITSCKSIYYTDKNHFNGYDVNIIVLHFIVIMIVIGVTEYAIQKKI